MDAPVAWLMRRATELEEDYGWISVPVLQRRLRVSYRFAEYLTAQLQDRRKAT